MVSDRIVTLPVQRYGMRFAVRENRIIGAREIAALQWWFDRWAHRHGMQAGTVRVQEADTGGIFLHPGVRDRRILIRRRWIGVAALVVQAVPGISWPQELLDHYRDVRHVTL